MATASVTLGVDQSYMSSDAWAAQDVEWINTTTFDLISSQGRITYSVDGTGQVTEMSRREATSFVGNTFFIEDDIVSVSSFYIRIYDVSDPQNPIEISDTVLPETNSLSFGTAILDGDQYYVVAYDLENGGYHLLHFDLSDPFSPSLLGRGQLAERNSLRHVYNDRALAIPYSERVFNLFDLSEPDNPTILDSIEIPTNLRRARFDKSKSLLQLSDGSILILSIVDGSSLVLEEVTDAAIEDYVADMAASDDRVAVIAQSSDKLNDGSLFVFDVSDPSAPVQTDLDTGLYSPGGLDIQGDQVLLANSHAGVRYYSIDASGTLELEDKTPDAEAITGLSVVGDVALLTDYLRGVRILDLADSGITERAAIPIPNGAFKISANEHAAIVSDYEGNLFVVDWNTSEPGVRANLENSGRPKHIEVIGQRGFVLDGSGAFRIFDLSDRSNPSLLLTTTDHYASSFTVTDSVVYFPRNNSGPERIDFSDLSNPVRSEASNNSWEASGYSLPVINEKAYLFRYDEIVPVDLSNWPEISFNEAASIPTGIGLANMGSQVDEINELLIAASLGSRFLLVDVSSENPKLLARSDGFQNVQATFWNDMIIAATATQGVLILSSDGTVDMDLNSLGEGTITADPPGPEVPVGSMVTLTATPGAGYEFLHWVGDVDTEQRNQNPVILELITNRTITAVFRPVVSFELPDSHTIALAGDTVTFNFGVSAPEESQFQWYHDGEAIAGQTASYLHLTEVSPADSGDYSLTVSTPTSGSFSSASVQLVVRPGTFYPKRKELPSWDGVSGEVLASQRGLFVVKTDFQHVTLYEASEGNLTQVDTFAFDLPVQSASFDGHILGIGLKASNIDGELHLFDVSDRSNITPYTTLPTLMGDGFVVVDGFVYTLNDQYLRSWSPNTPNAYLSSTSLNIGNDHVSQFLSYQNAGYIAISNGLIKVLDLADPYEPLVLTIFDEEARHMLFHNGELVLYGPDISIYTLENPLHPIMRSSVAEACYHEDAISTGRYLLVNTENDLEIWDTTPADTPVLFDSFSNDETGDLLPYVIGSHMFNADRSNAFELCATAELLVSSQRGDGIVLTDTDDLNLIPGTPVTFTPDPADGFFFYRWVGDVPSDRATEKPLTLEILQDQRVTAQFLPDPTIFRSPQSQLVPAGETIELSVSAAGGAGLSYQWRANGEIIPGAVGDTLLIPNASTLNSAQYDVVVTTASDSLVSQSASIEVTNAFATEALSSFGNAGPGDAIFFNSWLLTGNLTAWDLSDPMDPNFGHYWNHSDVDSLTILTNENLAITCNENRSTVVYRRGAGDLPEFASELPLGSLSEGLSLSANDRLYGLQDGHLTAYDLSDPMNPIQVGYSDSTMFHSFNGIAYGDYYYAAYNGSTDLVVVHIGDDERFAVVATVTKPYGYDFLLEADDDFLYMGHDDSITLFDLSDPSHPEMLDPLLLDGPLDDFQLQNNQLWTLSQVNGSSILSLYRKTGSLETPFIKVADLPPLPNGCSAFEVMGTLLLLKQDSFLIYNLSDDRVLGLSKRSHGTVEADFEELTRIPINTTTSITATPDEGYYFSHWLGDVPNPAEEGGGNTFRPGDVGTNPLTVSMDRNRSLLAVFFPSPSIHLQPTNQLALTGDRVTFPVVARGEGDLSFQWRKDGEILPDATTESLVIENASPADSGTYQLLISDGERSILSHTATLSVLPSLNPNREEFPIDDVTGATSLTISDGWAYILSDHLDIVDLHNPETPVRTARIANVDAYLVYNDTLYTSGDDAWLAVWDVSNPSQPSQLSAIPADAVPPTAPAEIFRIFRWGNRIALIGNSYAYPFWSGSVAICEVDNTGIPHFVGGYSLSDDTISVADRIESIPAGELVAWHTTFGGSSLFDLQQNNKVHRVTPLPHEDHTQYSDHYVIPWKSGYYVINRQTDPFSIEYVDWFSTNPPLITNLGNLPNDTQRFERMGNISFAPSGNTANYAGTFYAFGSAGVPQLLNSFESMGLQNPCIWRSSINGLANGNRLVRIELSPEPTLTIGARFGGSAYADPTGPSYPHNSDVTVSAVPEEGYFFSHWSGNVPTEQRHDNPLHLKLDHDRSIDAVFSRNIEILRSPDDRLAMLGGETVFSPDITAAQGSTFQWYRDGESISGATSPTLHLTNLTHQDSGEYALTISHNGSSRTTEASRLSVLSNFNPTERGDLPILPEYSSPVLLKGAILHAGADDKDFWVYDSTLANPDKPIIDFDLGGFFFTPYIHDNYAIAFAHYMGQNQYIAVDESDFSSPSVVPGLPVNPIRMWGNYNYSTGKIYDVADPFNPIDIGERVTNSDYPMVARGGYLYVFTGAVNIYSLEDPEKPEYLQYFGEFPLAKSMFVSGGWMVFPRSSRTYLVSRQDPVNLALVDQVDFQDRPNAYLLSGNLFFVASGSGGIYLYEITPEGSFSLVTEFGDQGVFNPDILYTDLQLDGSTLVAEVNHRETKFYQLSEQVNLRLSTVGGGDISTNVEAESFPPGTEVSLTALPDDNHLFSHWRIGGSRILRPENPLTLNLWDHRNVTAVFVEDSDLDNLPDYWETDQFGTLSPTSSQLKDGDSIMLMAEFFFMLDPNRPDPDGLPLPEMNVYQGNRYLTFDMIEESGFLTYRVHASDTLGGPAKVLLPDIDYEISNVEYRGTGHRRLTLRILDTNSRFYWVEIIRAQPNE